MRLTDDTKEDIASHTTTKPKLKRLVRNCNKHFLLVGLVGDKLPSSGMHPKVSCNENTGKDQPYGEVRKVVGFCASLTVYNKVK